MRNLWSSAAIAAVMTYGGGALAAEAASGAVVQEVVVTGEKVSRSLRNTASSVAVVQDITPDMATTSDLLARIPNLVTSEPTNLAPAVRGLDGTGPAQGADAFFAGTRPRLNFQVDGRTLSHNEAIFTESTLFDVERVEVFRGPQSTLQGRNAVAGAIIIRTRNPTYDFEGAAQALVGDLETRQASVAVSGPLIAGQVAARLSADWRRADSFADFTGYEGVDDPGKSEQVALRGKLLIEPEATPGLRALLTVSHMRAYAPQTADVVRPFGGHVAAFPFQPRFRTRSNSAILDASRKLGGGWSLELTASAADLRVNRYAVPGDGIAEINGKEYVLEPRLRFSGEDGRVTGFVGLHVFDADQGEHIDLFGGGTFDDSTRTYAAFGEGTVKLTDRLGLTVGGRLEREERRRTGGVWSFVIDLDETYEAFLPKASLSYRVNDDLTVGVLASRGYNGGGAGFTYDAPYESYVYDPEFVWNYEAFARALLLDGRLSLSGNIFYDRYRDLQLPFDLNSDPKVWSYVVRNAGRAETYGAEISARLIAARGLELFASGGLLKTEVTNYPGSDIEGNELPRSPAASLSFGADYVHASGFEAGFDVRYSDGYFSDIENKPFGEVDSYWVANARAAYRFGQAKVFATVANLFDEVGPVMLYPGDVRADDTATVLRPRTWQVGLRVDF
ncbi:MULTISPECIES: TonB-dependent receptor [Phenylobacterium]|uniref:Outer membrane receptor protein involved in Fe transport n=1 Tax=Phenylobacterium koreense TaxID=266125 RepID=A0ABV2EEF6_9CAUL